MVSKDIFKDKVLEWEKLEVKRVGLMMLIVDKLARNLEK
jgi:hypothetical protein